MAEPALGQRVHAVAVVGRPGIERVGDQHRVVERRDLDAAAGEDVPVELDVLADLEHAGVFEQRLQQRDRFGFGDLAGQQAAAVEQAGLAGAMADRDVAGLARRDGERDADELGLQRIERSRLGVEGDDARLEGAGDPRLQRRGVADGLVGGDVDRRGARFRRALGGERPRRARRRRRAAADAGAADAGAAAAGASGEAAASGAAGSPLRPRQPPGPTKRGSGSIALASRPQSSATRLVMVVNSIALRKAISGSASSLGSPSASSGASTVDVAHQRDELLREADELDAVRVGQRLAPLRLLDLAGAREQRIEIAVFADQLRRRLDADARRAGHVVGRIAGERLDVDDLVGAEAEIIDDLGRADAPLLAVAGSGVEHRDAGPDELHQVLVGRDDQHVGALRARLRRVGGDEVVGLVAVLLDRRQAEGADGVAHQRELRHEVVRRVGPVRLVGG